MRVPLRSVGTRSTGRTGTETHQENRLGYLLTLDTPELGYCGGLLVITSAGRPVAFHYTRPVKPTEMHRILYGASLDSFVRGHLIASGLIGACRQRPRLLLVADALLLPFRPAFALPMVATASEDAPDECASVTIADTRWLVHRDHMAEDQRVLEDALRSVGGPEVLGEPFQRVRLALERLIGNAEAA